MATEKEVSETFNQIETELGGFIACSLVDLESGMTLAVRSTRGEFDLAAASAYSSETADAVRPDPLHQDG